MNVNFEWDPAKAKSNLRKHQVSFEEAATVFRDPQALTIYDPDHSQSDERWITLGISHKGRLLVVCHNWTKEEGGSSAVRIFSSRKAGKKEKNTYGE